MPLDVTMVYATVRVIGALHPKLAASERGTIGTGFLITVPNEDRPSVRHGYVVTAAHVLSEQSKVEIQAPDPRRRGGLYPPARVDNWRRPLPKVDLAVAPWFEQGNFMALEIANLIPFSVETPLRLGGTIFYIGILTPLDVPMVRSGTIGALDLEGLSHQHGYEYPTHLVDCRSYAGFSGSPCFAQVIRANLTPQAMAGLPKEAVGIPMGDLQYFMFLAGMLTAHLSDQAKSGATSLYGVGTMLRGQEIRAVLMSDELKADRKRDIDAAEEMQNSEDEPALENLGGATPYQREDFLVDLHKVSRRRDEPRPEE
jgi:hypothetical protein